MKKMSSADIRRAFLDYFKSQQHQEVSSSSLIPANDPTLLFTNAGMVQFKDVFLGTEKRAYQRAASVQRCVRAGGKHNDLENVGFTARHHTFFEMLGNFSFGDYFKSEAIRMAWTFLTDILQIPAEKLWVTVYEEDLESEKIWLDEIGVSKERLTRCGAKDNFWAMGDTGPCGPCTEIYYDHGPSVAGGPPGSPDMEGDRYVEIWNVVFMQYNRDPSGNMHPLPKPSVDTGMGLERIAAVMQGVTSNYDTDIFVHLRKAIQQLKTDIDISNPSVLVIADHIRASTFLLADGVIPSNEGRGYVLRRIIRRAIRHGHKLELPNPFMCKLVQAVVDSMGDAYPYLKKQQSQIEQVLKQEEEQFLRTITQGLKLLEEALLTCQDKTFPGELAFKLYDTYGFPVDLTADALRELGYVIDMEGFEKAMAKQRMQSQQGSHFQAEFIELPTDIASTDFKGYEHHVHQAKVDALFFENQQTSSLAANQSGMVILSSTPFYAESGGQIGDVGELVGSKGTFVVTDTKRKGGLVLHVGYVKNGSFQEGEILEAKVDETRRQAIRCNHTATHLLHAALRQLLGESVQQKGSLVNDEISRFDFSLNRALTRDEIYSIEQLVNAKIRQNLPVITELLSLEAAQQKGAMALFGEKYADTVRVLSMGDFSMELCGGTHASQSGDIGLFKILSESSIASGVRRIEFVTADKALEIIHAQEQHVMATAQFLKCSPSEVLDRLQQQFQQLQTLTNELQHYEKKMIHDAARTAVDKHHAPYLVLQLENYDMKSLRLFSDAIRDFRPDLMCVLCSKKDEQLAVMAIVPKALQATVGPASDWVRLLCEKGGGRPDFAQGGGFVPENLQQKLEDLEQKLKVYF